MNYILKHYFHLALLKPELIQTSQIMALCFTLILVTYSVARSIGK